MKKIVFLRGATQMNSNMQTLQIKISKSDFERYKLKSTEIKFTDLVELISNEYARETLLDCNEIAEQEGLSKMTSEEINAEIKAVRDAKDHS
ncbi:hypothetical protein G3O08_02840 [Cryomorpha ignava]|uniref:Uncharacterized protein n=1 Tax=Cryomorpha ignava TaxID=101383 RepID=A0A7K3WLC3_9FLAO|nr:hypothetical protein [Cryomorpha ignava]NEN22437.1 hypothetical protein [Cryomorpha ignava]